MNMFSFLKDKFASLCQSNYAYSDSEVQQPIFNTSQLNSEVLLFNINQTSTIKERNPSKFNDDKWMHSFVPSTDDFGGSDFSNIKPILTSYTSDITHGGLIGYLYYCWAKEIGVELRPDMLYYRLISEIAHDVLKCPNDYRKIFTDSDVKKEILIETTGEYDLDPETLVAALKKLVPNKEFLDLIVNTKFASEPEGAQLARNIVFCQMGIPYYSYMTCLCGIPSVKIEGTIDDWMLLYNNINRLIALLNGINHMTDFIKQYNNIIGNIIYFSFGHKVNDVKLMYSNGVDFYKDMFNNDENPRCGSGHTPDVVHGWILKLFLKTYRTSEKSIKVKKLVFNNGNFKEIKEIEVETYQDINFDDFDADITYVPYKNMETNRMFSKAIGLVYSNYDKENNRLSPQYGHVIHEVLTIDLFNKIAMN